MLWSVCEDFKLAVKSIDGDFLIYNCGSGETHRLSLEAGRVFELLWRTRTPVSLESLMNQARECSFDHLDQSSLSEILNGLCGLHLVKAN